MSMYIDIKHSPVAEEKPNTSYTKLSTGAGFQTTAHTV